jgi:hypothetical protein
MRHFVHFSPFPDFGEPPYSKKYFMAARINSDLYVQPKKIHSHKVKRKKKKKAAPQKI